VSENSLARRAYFSESDFSKMLIPEGTFLVCTKCVRSKSIISVSLIIFGHSVRNNTPTNT
jgi:hypothetical protein